MFRGHCGEALERRWCWAMCEALADRLGTLNRAEHRGIDLKIIDARNVDFTLPQANRIGNS